MEVQLIIFKDRIPYIIECFGENKVSIYKYSDDRIKIIFKLENNIDVLHLFHAGVRCGLNEERDFHIKLKQKKQL